MPTKRMTKTEKRAASAADEAYLAHLEAQPKPSAEMLALEAAAAEKAAAKSLRFIAWETRKKEKKARRATSSGNSAGKGGRTKGAVAHATRV